MNSKINFQYIKVALFVCIITMASISGFSQACVGNQVTVTLQNIQEDATHTQVEFDVWISNTGTTSLRLAALQGSVIINTGFLPTGATGTFTMITSPAATGNFLNFNNPVASYIIPSRQLKWTNTAVALSSGNTVDLPLNTPKKFARFRFTSSLAFTSSFAGTLSPSFVVLGGITNVLSTVYCSGNPNSTGLGSATANTLVVQSSYPITLNIPCPSAATASNLVSESPCVGAANGIALITLTGAPNNSSVVTYTIDGGISQNATLTSGAFTVSNLSAGSHFVAVTYPSCSTISTSSFSIGAGAALTTNGSVTTSICAGGSYTWPANNTTYSTAQTGFTVVSGCNTATLNLTVTPLTTTGSVTTSICAGGSYTWPANGVTYTTAQTNLTVVSGCNNTATLNLSVTPNATPSVSVAASASTICAGAAVTFTATTTSGGTAPTYQWKLNGTNVGTGLTTYTNSSLANGAVVTVVMTPNNTCQTSSIANGNNVTMTVTPATTTGSVTTSICSGGSYTWPANGVTYTSAQTNLTAVSGCNTATLNLSVIPNATPSVSVAASATTICDGTSVTFTATPTNGGSPTYQWKLNGTNVGTGIASYTNSSLANGAVVTVVMTSNNTCQTSSIANGNNVTMTVTPVLATTTGSVTTSICTGGSYTWPANGVTYTTAQTNLTLVSGCNTATLNLTVTPAATTTGSVSTSICAGGSYTWPENGVTYTTAQTGVTIVSGCNTATLNLTVIPATTTGSISTSICAGGSYTWPENGVTYITAQTNLTVVSGCNTATLNLTIILNTSDTTTITACGSYIWNGTTYTESGVYSGITTNCVTESLDLTITPISINTTTITACGSYIWNGITYTASGVYTGTITNCVTESLDLTITLAPAQPTGLSCWQTATFNTATCAWDVSGTQPVVPTGLSCWQTATFNIISCLWDVSGTQPEQPTLDFCETTLFNVDSCAWIVSSTIQENIVNVDAFPSYFWVFTGQTYTTSGTYEFLDTDNCILQILNLTLTSDLSEEFSNTLSIYPNPTNGNVVISLFSDDQSSLDVYDSQGQLVFENPSISNGEEVNLSDYSPGVYIFRVYTSNQIYTRRIIKN
jgi:hypothetical protein